MLGELVMRTIYQVKAGDSQKVDCSCVEVDQKSREKSGDEGKHSPSTNNTFVREPLSIPIW